MERHKAGADTIGVVSMTLLTPRATTRRFGADAISALLQF